MSERGYGQVVRCSLLSHNSLVALVPAGRQRLLHNWEHARLHMECVSHRQRSDKTYHSDHGHIAQHPSDVRSHLAHCSTLLYESSPRSHASSTRRKSSSVHFRLEVAKAVLSLGLLHAIRRSNRGSTRRRTLRSSLGDPTFHS